jgi:hypothetical protein
MYVCMYVCMYICVYVYMCITHTGAYVYVSCARSLFLLDWFRTKSSSYFALKKVTYGVLVRPAETPALARCEEALVITCRSEA